MQSFSEEKNYLSLLSNIVQNGSERSDRTGTGTRSIFGTQLKFSLEDNTLPLITTKKMYVKGIVEELLFFIRGDTNSKKLEEKGVNIWKGNTSREFLDKRGLLNYSEGEMGPMYGAQWRNFQGVDQLKNAFNLIKNEPSSRRIVVSAYDPSVSHLCVLDPCHMFFQFYVDGINLSCQYYQRSVDFFLGSPFNIASYAILTHLMANATGLKAKELIMIGGDSHCYLNHIEQAKLQLTRDPYDFPKLKIKKDLTSIDDIENLQFSDFDLINYQHHAAITATMAV